MKIATILPLVWLSLEEKSHYHMCLGHLMEANFHYRDFFRKRAHMGCHVIMDNGVVETGVPMGAEQLLRLTHDCEITEVILPDQIGDRDATLKLGHAAFRFGFYKYGMTADKFMAVPQGKDAASWMSCAREMLNWPVRSIGISKFVLKHFPSRLEALYHVPEVLASHKEIHLLGCPGDPGEIAQIEQTWPYRIRGVDSVIAAAYTAAGMSMASGASRPTIEIDLLDGRDLNGSLLRKNRQWWINRALGLQGAR